MNSINLENIDLDNSEFQNAWNLIRNTHRSVFLTGKAGTGKSTFLKYICAHTSKEHVVLAPTGIAAVNVGGQTLHSFFKIPFKPLLPDDPDFSPRRIRKTLRYSSEKVKLIRKLQLIIIDEISMVRCDVIDFIDKDVAKESIGHGYEKFSPYLMTVFLFILTSNLLGLIPVFPGGANLTGNIAVTLTCAVTAFIAINCFAPKGYYKSIFWPDVPIFLKAPLPIMPTIEFIGVFTKPFSLTVRLFANIMAGHIIILALTSVVFVTAKMGTAMCASMTAVSVLFCIFMNCLELLVAFIQAYVFTILTANFIGLAHDE